MDSLFVYYDKGDIMFFPFSFYRNRQIEDIQNKSALTDNRNEQVVLPPSARYIHNLLYGAGIRVEIKAMEDESWVPLYLPESKRLVAVHIRGDSVLTKIKAKAFVKKHGVVHAPSCPIDWIFPASFYADCTSLLKKIAPFR